MKATYHGSFRVVIKAARTAFSCGSIPQENIQNNGGKSIVECRQEKVILDIYCNSCVAENGMLEEGEAMELIEQRGES